MKAMILALALVAAVVPLASASNNVCTPDNTTCVSEGSYTYGDGDCTSSPSGYHAEQNYVNVYSYGTPLGYTYVYATNDCYWEEFFGYTFNGDEVFAYAYNQNTGEVYAQWYHYGGSFGDGCSTSVGSYGTPVPINTGDLGCPTGSGPGMILPPVLP